MAAKPLQVTAPLVVARTKNDRVVNLYLGDVITDDISQASIDHLKSLGFLTDEPQAASQPAS